MMRMGNSPMVCYKKLSPNCTSPRTHTIDTITVHCMAGDCSIEACGGIFAAPARQASSNYGIGSDGRVGLYVAEQDRSWCTSNAANDHRAVTIEVANDGGADTGWHVSPKAMAALIDLCADICRRNGIKRLLWKADKALIGQVDKQNMTVHRWFANKACPGDYLYQRHGFIADEVNQRLGGKDIAAPTAPASPVPYTVRVTAGSLNIRRGPGTAYAIAGSITDKGVYTIVAEADGAGAKRWGKLKSGAGWISLDHTQKT
jgi:SH3-like domain-containing protein